MLQTFTVLALSLAGTVLGAAVHPPLEGSSTHTFYHPNGFIEDIELHPSVRFVSTYNATPGGYWGTTPDSHWANTSDGNWGGTLPRDHWGSTPDDDEDASIEARPVDLHHKPHKSVQCGYSMYFTDRTTHGSPFTEDCRWLAQIVSQPRNMGYFLLAALIDIKPNGDWVRLATHKTCTFGVKTKNLYGTKVGTTDIGVMLNASIILTEKTIHKPKMQYEGRFPCNTWATFLLAGSKTKWAIFKPLRGT
ncbi:hypothetical protein F4810DRAFT_719077 [Camillea tinctor]|nr:hypothetical protein F4810DRAFT_719077 [Camillea tinctor]